MKPAEKWLVWGGTTLTGVTGIVYLWMKYFLDPIDEFSVVNHPLEPFFLKAHILTAPLLVFAIGAIGLRHIWSHFRSGTRPGRRSGVTAALTVGPLIISGYALQVVVSNSAISVAAWAHIITGILFLTAIGVHQVVHLPRWRR